VVSSPLRGDRLPARRALRRWRTAFENYFREISVFDQGEHGRPDLERFAEVNARYDLEMDFDSIGDLCDRFGLTHPLA
jgi:hypothetical protein